jgi:two-component system response regulator HydG
VVLSKGKAIDFTAIPEDIVSTTDKPDIPAKVKSLKDVEYSMILHTLQACNGNKSMAAKRLGISRKALYKRLKDFAIPPSPDTSAVKPWSYE